MQIKLDTIRDIYILHRYSNFTAYWEVAFEFVLPSRLTSVHCDFILMCICLKKYHEYMSHMLQQDKVKLYQNLTFKEESGYFRQTSLEVEVRRDWLR